MDLAALDQVARLLDPEAGRDEMHREFDRVGNLEETPSVECEVWQSERPLAVGQLALPATQRREGANSGGLSIFQLAVTY